MNWLSLVPMFTLALSVSGFYVDMTTFDALSRFRLNTLIDLVKLVGLDKTLDDPTANITLFAPTDRAFSTGLRNVGLTLDEAKKQPDEVKKILLYHAVSGHHTTRDFVNERVFTTLSNEHLRTNHYVYNNYYLVDGARILSRDIETKNGVIHMVSGILFPFEGNVYDIIANSSDLSTLKAAIDATGLAPVLADQNPITIFCPTNDAFAKLGSLVPKLLNKPDLLKEILLYHVIPGSLYKGGMHDTTLHSFEEKDKIMLDHHGFYDELDDARFVNYDISADNGVIHKLSGVLVPSSLEDQVKNL